MKGFVEMEQDLKDECEQLLKEKSRVNEEFRSKIDECTNLQSILKEAKQILTERKAQNKGNT